MLFPLMFSLAVLQPGCVVGLKKHEALQASHDALQVEHSALQARYEADTTTMRGQILSLEEALTAAEAEAARLGQELTTLQSEKARLVKDTSSLQASVKEMETALIELSQRKAQADARVAEYRNLLARFKALIDEELKKADKLLADGTPKKDLYKKIMETAAKIVTFESWLRIGQEDAKALDFYRKAGNEIIELSDEVQFQTNKTAKAWARKQAETNAWFKKVFESQLAFETLWKDAARYRNVKTDPKG